MTSSALLWFCWVIENYRRDYDIHFGTAGQIVCGIVDECHFTVFQRVFLVTTVRCDAK